MQLDQKYEMGRQLKNLCLAALASAFLSGCGAEGNDTGTEYAPQMYHSVSYSPLTQITDKDAGMWLTSRDSIGEFFNTNIYNPHNMNMRVPPANTVPRRESGFLPATIPADTLGSTYWLDYASANLTNPYDTASNPEAILQEGQALFGRFCFPCHGGTGQGDGPVGQVILGVPSFTSGRVQGVSEGHIFYVITHGKGRMGSYASQLDIDERWKIVKYVQQLQNQ